MTKNRFAGSRSPHGFRDATILTRCPSRPKGRWILGLWLAFGSGACALADATLPNAALEQRRHEDRANELRQREERRTDVRRPAVALEQLGRIPEGEAPCFTLTRLELAGEGHEKFRWLLNEAAGPERDDAATGRCLGAQGINLVIRRLQNALIAEGYITSRVSAAPQDLTRGTLVISLALGRINAIRLADGSPFTSLDTALPARPGDVLNLRDIEQGLENLKRVPSAEANIRIEPSAAQDRSDIVIDYIRSAPFRARLSVDDGGTRATGRYQGGVVLSYDNPFNLNDLSYLSLSHDLQGQGGMGTYGVLGHYDLPYGYWNLGITLSENRDTQTVAGAFQDYRYRGASQYGEIKAARMIHRDGRSKTSLSAGVFRRASKNFIDDTEVEVQRRVVGGWLFGIQHRTFISDITLNAGLTYKQGEDMFGAIEAPEHAFGEGTSRFRLTQLDLGLTLPIELTQKRLIYSANLRGQWNATPLTPQDRLAIGGRYSVRGFDGETVLSGDSGWLLRNELAMPLAPNGIEGYLGLDAGRVGGPSSSRLPGKTLSGAVIGVRGNWKKLGYDVFVGAPLAKPDGFRTADVTAGFSMNARF
jgi:hemolysin activation/secretion protein